MGLNVIQKFLGGKEIGKLSEEKLRQINKNRPNANSSSYNNINYSSSENYNAKRYMYGNGASTSISSTERHEISKPNAIVENLDLNYLNKELVERLSGLKEGSVKYRNTILDYRIEKSGGLHTREAVVAAAKYLSEEEDIPYYWGAKRNEYGVDKEWGKNKQLNYQGTEMQPQGGTYPYGLDCSGFVSWTITNGGFNMPSTYTEAYIEYANYNVDNFKSGKIKAGDLLYREGHIAIITDLDLDGGIIKVAEEKGAEYGMVVTKTKIEKFVNSNAYTSIYSLENYYNNKENFANIK